MTMAGDADLTDAIEGEVPVDMDSMELTEAEGEEDEAGLPPDAFGEKSWEVRENLTTKRSRPSSMRSSTPTSCVSLRTRAAARRARQTPAELADRHL